MSFLAFTIPAAVVLGIISIVLVVAGVFTKKEHRPYTGAEVMLGWVYIVAMLATVIPAVTVLFDAIAYLIPDPLIGAYRDAPEIRLAISCMVVALPISIVAGMRMMRAQVWMQRFVAGVFALVAGVTLAGVIMYSLYAFLNGELGMRLALKLLTVGTVSGLFAWFYGTMLRTRKAPTVRIARIFVGLLVLFTVKAVVWGFVMTGGPAGARAERFDERRLQDLSSIQSGVQSFWYMHKRLPRIADELEDPISGYSLPIDPETGVAYGYEPGPEAYGTESVTGEQVRVRTATFTLCATFATERTANDTGYGRMPMMDMYAMYEYYPGDMSPHWNHPMGRHCFTRNLKDVAPIEKGGLPASVQVQ